MTQSVVRRGARHAEAEARASAGSFHPCQTSRVEGPRMSERATIQLLEGFLDAFNGHDLDSIFGVSEWTLTGTSVSGKSVEVRGVDLLEFVDGKITRKDSFWKME